MKVSEFFHNVYYLSKDELISFEKFLNTSYFNTMDSQYMVYKIIRRHSHYIKSEKYDELKDIIINESNYSETTVRKILSGLNDSLIEFTKIQSRKDNHFLTEYNYCNYLLKMGNYELLDSRMEELDNSLKDLNSHDNDYFLKMFEKDTLKYDVLNTTEDKFEIKSKLNKQKNYTLESTKNLKVYTISKTVINLVNFVFQRNTMDDYNEGLFPVDMDDLFRFIKTPKFKMFNSHQKNTIKLFYKLYKLFSNPLSDENYDEYKEYYDRIKEAYNEDFKKTQHNISMNYCFLRQRMADKDKKFAKEVIDILNEYVDNKYYVNDKTKYLNPAIYRNFIINCIKTDSKTKLFKFVNKHSDKLHPKETEIMKIYGMAQYYYLNGEYELSIINAELINNPKSFYKYDIINLLIKANYELNNFVKVRELLHNYKTYADKDILLTDADKEWYFKFVEYTHKFLSEKDKYLNKDETFNIEHLLHKIETETDFSTKKWLTEKLKTFISAHNKKQTKK